MLAGFACCGMDLPSLGITSRAGASAPFGALPVVVPVAKPLPTVLNGHLPCMPHQSSPPCPDPEGLDKPPSPRGGQQFWGYGGSPSFFGGHPRFHGGSWLQHFSFPSSGSTANHWRTYNFHGGIPSAVPSFFHGGINLSPPCSSCVGGLPMHLHLWHLCLLLRLLCCIL
jgi:hypothetical protein